MKEGPKPPGFAIRFLKVLSEPYWHDEVIGDLEEQYIDNLERYSRWKANLLYWFETLRFIRLHIIRKPQKLNTNMMTFNHIKISYRNLIRNKIYAFINILGLSVGLASVILLGLYINFETSYDKFFDDSDRIYRVALNRIYPTRTKDFGTSAVNVATVLKANYPQVEEATRLHRLFFQNEIPVEIEELEKTFVETRFLFADSLFFDVFSYSFIVGNAETALDNRESIVITRSTAMRYFGTVDVLNKTVRSGEDPLKITGVIEDIPDNSHIHFDVLGSVTSLQFWESSMQNDNWTSPWVYTYIKLREGADPDALESQFESMVDRFGNANISSGIGANWKENGHAFDYFLQPLSSIHLHSQLDVEVEPNGNISYIYILSAIALMILVISSINFINLSIARSTERAKEVGIRKVLGSFRVHLISQFLTESILTCLIAAILSIGILYFFIPRFNDLLGTYLNFGSLLGPISIALILAFVVILGVLAGLYPAFTFSSLRPVRILKGSFKSSYGGVWLRNVLITFQFLISIVMIAGSIIADQQMRFLQNKNLGFDKDNLLVIKQAYNLGDDFHAFTNDLKALSAVKASGYANMLPGQFHGSQVYKVNDPTIPDIRVNTCFIDDNYFDAIGFELLSGRKFQEEFDDSLSIIVNESTVKAMGIENPIGYKFQAGVVLDTQTPQYTIIGLVKDYHFYSLHNEVGPMVLFNIQPGNLAANTVVRMSTPNTLNAIEDIRALWEKYSEDEFNYSFLDLDLQLQYESDQNTASLFNIFTYIAIIMSCTGLFGLATYIVNQRSKEMSIRKVLGATLPHIIMVFSREFIILIAIAFIIGTPIAFYTLNQWLFGFAYHVNIGFTTFILAGLLTIALVLITVSYQAIKIARVNPVKMLRSE